MKLILRRS